MNLEVFPIARRYTYAELPASVSAELYVCTGLIARSFENSESEAIAVGEVLLRAQAAMAKKGGGDFQDWIWGKSQSRLGLAVLFVDD